MNTEKPEARKICGAKTRAGTPCRRAPMFNGRCSLHGGKSRGWFAHPNYKHGRYSKYSPVPLMEKVEKMKKRRTAAFLKAWAKKQAELGRELSYEELRLLLRAVHAKFAEKEQKRKIKSKIPLD
jgi:hypothetical protein